MSSALTLFACIENVDRVISYLYQVDCEDGVGQKCDLGLYLILK